MTVTGTNDAPVAKDDTGTTHAERVLNVADGDTGSIVTNDDSTTMTVNAGLLVNDKDTDTTDKLTITQIAGFNADLSTPTIYNPGQAAIGARGGTFTIEADGSWTFDPTGLAGETTSVAYTVTDPHGLTSTATLTVTVVENRDPEPIADAAAVNADKTLTVADGDVGSDSGTINADLLLNDTDPDGGPLTITAVTGYTRGRGRQLPEADKGGASDRRRHRGHALDHPPDPDPGQHRRHLHPLCRWLLHL